MMPLMSIGILALFLIIPNLDPLKDNIAEFREIFNLFIFVIMLFLAYIWALTIFWNLGFTSFKMSTAILPAMGFLFLLIGYMLRQAKRNWFVGIRTPWTLSSDTVWSEIHRLGSKLFVASGVLSFLGIFFEDYAIWFVLVPVLGSTFFLYIYSYILFRKETMSAK